MAHAGDTGDTEIMDPEPTQHDFQLAAMQLQYYSPSAARAADDRRILYAARTGLRIVTIGLRERRHVVLASKIGCGGAETIIRRHQDHLRLGGRFVEDLTR